MKTIYVADSDIESGNSIDGIRSISNGRELANYIDLSPDDILEYIKNKWGPLDHRSVELVDLIFLYNNLGCEI